VSERLTVDELMNVFCAVAVAEVDHVIIWTQWTTSNSAILTLT